MSATAPPAIALSGVARTFVLHSRGGAALPVLAGAAHMQAAASLDRFDPPCTLRGPSPKPLSGGGTWRVTVAGGFVHRRPVPLLDEPAASLDAGNRERVLALIGEARARAAAILGIVRAAAARMRRCDPHVGAVAPAHAA